MAPGRGEAAADAADAREQVDGAEIRAGLVRGAEIQFAQRGNIGAAAFHLARLPALHRRGGYLQRFGELAACHGTAQQRDKFDGFIVLSHGPCLGRDGFTTHREYFIS